MTHRTISIRDWLVDVFIDDGTVDTGQVLDCLVDMGASFDTIRKAIRKMRTTRPNNAFTYSVWRWTCVFIGWTTDAWQFLNSMVHEIRHLVDHIADAYGIPYDGEGVGYISGDAAYLLAEDICEFGCPHCRE